MSLKQIVVLLKKAWWITIMKKNNKCLLYLAVFSILTMSLFGCSESKIKSITISDEEVTLLVNQTYQIQWDIAPNNFDNSAVLWSSEDSQVAVINQNGLITAIGVGSTNMTVKAASDPNIYATCYVDVRAIDSTSVVLNKNSLTLIETYSEKLTADIVPSSATYKSVKWSSINPDIASVDSDGNVEAIHVGETIIRAASFDEKNYADCSVVVTPLVAVEGINVGLGNNHTMKIGTSANLDASVYPENASITSLEYFSSNEEIVSVDEFGTINANNIGSATIAISSIMNRSIYVGCLIKVEEIFITKFEINLAQAEMFVGETLSLFVEIEPSDATFKAISWTSSDDETASVEDGLVTAIKAGNVIIEAKSADSKHTASCSITISNVAVTGLNISHYAKTMYTGENFKLVATVLPNNATNKSVLWESSNTYVASVSSDGTVSAHYKGQATITATTSEGGYTKSCALTVNEITATSITLNTSSQTILKGDTYQLVATVLPINAVNKAVTWSSSSQNYATVNSTGLVTGVNVGSAVIIARTSNGLEASCTINVASAPTSVSLNKYQLALKINDAFKLSAVVAPSNAIQEVAWSSSAANVASVDSTGNIKAKSAGQALITAKTVNNISISCKVTVISSNEVGISLYSNQKLPFTTELSIVGTKATVTDIEYGLVYQGNSVMFTFYGYKSYDKTSSTRSMMIEIQCILYDSNNSIIASEELAVTSLVVSQSFTKDWIVPITLGNVYTLRLT
jgi:uncharacterized protein YjdB